MAEWWIRVGGAGAQDGTSEADAAPDYATIAASVGEDDTVRIKGGEVHRFAFAPSSETGVTFTRWEGDIEPWHLRRSQVESGDWNAEDLTGTFDVYATSASTYAAAPESVWEDYDSTRFPFGDGRPGGSIVINGGWLPFVADPLDLPETRGWSYDATDDRLLISVPKAEDPGDHAYEVGQTGDGMTLSNCTNCTVERFWVSQCNDDGTGQGYGIRWTNGVSGNTMRRGRVSNCGYHNVGFVGSDCVDNRMEDLILDGAKVGNDSISVYFCLDGSAMTGCTMDRCHLHKVPYLDFNGDPYAPGQVKGFAHHTASPSEIAVAGLVCTRCATHDYGHNATSFHTDIVASGDHAAPTDDTDETTYPVQYIECEFHGAGLNASDAAGEASMSFTRCSFTGELETLSATPSVGAHNWSGSGANKGLYVSCTLSYSMPDAANEVIVRVGNGCTIRFYNSSLYLRGSYTNGAGIFFANTGVILIAATQTVFDMELSDQGYLTRGNLTSADVAMSDNFYSDTIGTTKYGSGASTTINDQTDWSGTIDTAGVYDEDGDFEDETLLRPASTSWLFTNTDATADPKEPIGVNGVAYDGYYGAWQFPDAPAFGLAAQKVNCCNLDWEPHEAAPWTHYRVDRRLAADPDEDESYATLGRCPAQTTLARWENSFAGSTPHAPPLPVREYFRDTSELAASTAYVWRVRGEEWAAGSLVSNGAWALIALTTDATEIIVFGSIGPGVTNLAKRSRCGVWHGVGGSLDGLAGLPSAGANLTTLFGGTGGSWSDWFDLFVAPIAAISTDFIHIIRYQCGQAQVEDDGGAVTDQLAIARNTLGAWGDNGGLSPLEALDRGLDIFVDGFIEMLLDAHSQGIVFALYVAGHYANEPIDEDALQRINTLLAPLAGTAMLFWDTAARVLAADDLTGLPTATKAVVDLYDSLGLPLALEAGHRTLAQVPLITDHAHVYPISSADIFLPAVSVGINVADPLTGGAIPVSYDATKLNPDSHADKEHWEIITSSESAWLAATADPVERASRAKQLAIASLEVSDNVYTAVGSSTLLLAQWSNDDWLDYLAAGFVPAGDVGGLILSVRDRFSRGRAAR
jgi:hypothetical protein